VTKRHDGQWLDPRVEEVRQMTRRQTRGDIARALLAYGAFGASRVVSEGDDARALARLNELQAKLPDERGVAIRRLIRGLKRIQEEEAST
jgi:hypothetical protein